MIFFPICGIKALEAIIYEHMGKLFRKGIFFCATYFINLMY